MVKKEKGETEKNEDFWSFQENFLSSFQKLMAQPGAPKKQDLAWELGVSPGYITNLLNGHARGTEATRRAIARALGTTYEAMIGVPDGVLLVERFACRVSVAEMRRSLVDLEGEGVQYAQIVPKVPVDAALSGQIEDCSQIHEWHLVRPMECSQVVVGMPDQSMGETIPEGVNLVVALEPGRLDNIREGGFYLVGPPSVVPVRQVFTDVSGGEALIILTSLCDSVAPPQVLHEGQEDALKGRVVGLHEASMDAAGEEGGVR